MEQANTVDFEDWHNQLAWSAVTSTLHPQHTITDTYNFIYTELTIGFSGQVAATQ